MAAIAACRGIPASARIAGFTKMIYDMVMKVVNPANISVLTVVPRSDNLKIDSIKFPPKTFFIYSNDPYP